MTWPPGLGLTLCALALAAAGQTAYGALRWAGAMQKLQRSLDAGRTDGRRDADSPPARDDARALKCLPTPVQRYFRAVLSDGQPIITAVTIDIAGTFNLSTTGKHWKPFTSRQRVTTRRPGFVWGASSSMLPGVKAAVVDSYSVDAVTSLSFEFSP